jgi:Uma2 family endonuclease
MTLQMPKVELGRPATYADLAAIPDHLVAELVNGELWTTPRPAPRHAVAASRLGYLIGPRFEGGRGSPRGWRIVGEPELHLGNHSLVPDLAGWRVTRMPRLPTTAYFALAPDWVCEVVSPSTAVLDRTRKLHVYAAHGVGHLWLVDPILRTLDVLRRGDDGHWVLLDTHAGDAVVRAEPFDTADLPLGSLWEDDDADPT